MKVLVTGGAGFIGSHVVDKLLEAGHDVVVIDNLSTGKRENVDSRAKFYQVDINEPDVLRWVFDEERPDVVNHHAAQVSVIASMKEPIEDAIVNILGSLNLIKLSVEYKVKKFIYISSGGAIYGNPQYLPCDEKHPINPLSPYGVSKHTVEHYLYLFRENYGLDYVVLRYPNVYGPRQDPYGEAGVVAIFSKRMWKKQPVIIYGDGTQERDFVYVGDIAEANLLAMNELNIDEPPIFNLGWGRGESVNKIFRILAEITGYEHEPVHEPPRPGEVYKISLNAQFAREVLGWQPKVELEDGLRITAEWFKEND